MEYMHFDIDAKQVTLHPLGDWHLGAPQCNMPYIKKVVQEIESNPEARWMGMGDLIENAIIGSAGDLYKQTMSPKVQIDEVVRLLTPIRGKCLFVMPGNHEERSMRVVGLHPDQHIASQLFVPYCEYSCLFTLDLLKAHTPRSFSIYAHHNPGRGVVKLRLICPNVDATFGAHTHTSSRTPVTWFEAGYKKALKKTGYDYVTGSALTWDKSYAEEKVRRPSTVEHIKVTFVGPTNGSGQGRRQIYEIIEP